jgi:hypothetical protein
MAKAIQLQLQRHDQGSMIGKLDAKQLRSWDDACEALLKEYTKAEATAQTQYKTTRLRKRTMIILPIWFLFTIVLANYIYVLALIRSLLGGLSLRYYLKTMFNQLFALPKHKDRM